MVSLFFFIHNIIIITTDNIFPHASFNYNKLSSQPPRKQINKNKPLKFDRSLSAECKHHKR